MCVLGFATSLHPSACLILHPYLHPHLHIPCISASHASIAPVCRYVRRITSAVATGNGADADVQVLQSVEGVLKRLDRLPSADALAAQARTSAAELSAQISVRIKTAGAHAVDTVTKTLHRQVQCSQGADTAKALVAETRAEGTLLENGASAAATSVDVGIQAALQFWVERRGVGVEGLWMEVGAEAVACAHKLFCR